MNITNLEVLFITRDHYENPWLLPYPFQTYENGATAVQEQITFDGRTTLMSQERHGNTEAFKSLNISTFPTIFFIDMDVEQILMSLEGLWITEDEISNRLLFIENLDRTDEGSYNTPDDETWLPEVGLGLVDIQKLFKYLKELAKTAGWLFVGAWLLGKITN